MTNPINDVKIIYLTSIFKSSPFSTHLIRFADSKRIIIVIE